MKIGFSKDGGQESTVQGWFIEAKKIATAVLLRFDDGTREAYHSHAFNCCSWVLKGALEEEHLTGGIDVHRPSLKPVITRRDTFHKVRSLGTTWVISFRGPWADTWKEYVDGKIVTLTNGRKVVNE